MRVEYGSISKRELEIMIKEKENAGLMSRERLNKNLLYLLFAYVFPLAFIAAIFGIMLIAFSSFNNIISQVSNGTLFKNEEIYMICIPSIILFSGIIYVTNKKQKYEDEYLTPYKLSEKEQLVKKLSTSELIGKNIIIGKPDDIKVELVFSINNSNVKDDSTKCETKIFNLKVMKNAEEEYLDIENMTIYVRDN